jgi:hypothetical protein
MAFFEAQLALLAVILAAISGHTSASNIRIRHGREQNYDYSLCIIFYSFLTIYDKQCSLKHEVKVCIFLHLEHFLLIP